VPLFQRATGFGFSGVRVDGNDVLACYAVTRRALDDARHGQGPSLVEAYTYRMGAHTTSDDPTRYRIASEVQAWEAKDPILRLRRHLERIGAADDAFFGEVADHAAREAVTLRERVLTMPDPAPVAMFEHVYAEPSAVLAGQRDEFMAYAATFEGGQH
jgi:2-oxoisovalerate dehydrogenase E1 component subunit alpha